MCHCRSKKLCSRMLTGVFIFTLLLTFSVAAQKSDRPARKRVYSVDPVYPQILKQAYIGGVVRLHLLVASNGNVERVSLIGGNPALVEAAMVAVKKWKYSTADSSTDLDVNIEFDPRRGR